MHHQRRPAALLALALLSLPAAAQEARPAAVSATAPEPPRPQGCANWPSPGLEEGPVAVGYYEADFATGRRACPRTEVGLGGRGGAIIDTANFYGALSADALLFGSYAVNPGLEVFGTLEAAHLQYVQNASLKGTNLTLGQLTAGATWVAWQQGDVALSPSARLMLPTSFANPGVYTVGAELGAAALYRPSGWLELHGYAGADYSAGLSAAPALPRPGAQLLVGAQYSPWDWFGLALDVGTHFGARAPLDYVAPALALRFRIYRGLGAELGATLPVLGADRHNAIGGLKLTWRL